MDFMLTIILLGIVVIQSLIIILLVSRKTSDGGKDIIKALEKIQQQSERIIREDIVIIRRDGQSESRSTRKEISESLHSFSDSLVKRMHESSLTQKAQFDSFSKQLMRLTQQNDHRLELIRETLEKKLTILQQENSQKLEQMRATVDEKLHATLEKRLSQSFQSVSERLEQVHKGLGEMQTLATGVGDLKKVLTNVKTRGTWGEVQLGNLLEQILTKDQYDTNVATKKNASGRVEFAVKLPGRDADLEYIWLPIDAKFPIEDYQRLMDASDQGDAEAVVIAQKALERRIKDQAKTIQSLYVDPPYTTDFAILFLPIEGLYAEILRMPGFVEMIQREYRVMITGPTTITAILNSLQMGFRTLAIEKRSSQIWKTLAEVKTDFEKFGGILEKTKKKLQEASNHIDAGERRVRSIERKLTNVNGLAEGSEDDSVSDSETAELL